MRCGQPCTLHPMKFVNRLQPWGLGHGEGTFPSCFCHSLESCFNPELSPLPAFPAREEVWLETQDQLNSFGKRLGLEGSK